MARLLLGVSGGIAAYKALELARLATLAGHGVRVVMTETATRFVGAASFEGIVGAPVLVSEFERDPMRGAFPGDDQAAHDPIGHLELAGRCDAYLIAPASAQPAGGPRPAGRQPRGEGFDRSPRREDQPELRPRRAGQEDRHPPPGPLPGERRADPDAEGQARSRRPEARGRN